MSLQETEFLLLFFYNPNTLQQNHYQFLEEQPFHLLLLQDSLHLLLNTVDIAKDFIQFLDLPLLIHTLKVELLQQHNFLLEQ